MKTLVLLDEIVKLCSLHRQKTRDSESQCPSPTREVVQELAQTPAYCISLSMAEFVKAAGILTQWHFMKAVKMMILWLWTKHLMHTFEGTVEELTEVYDGLDFRVSKIKFAPDIKALFTCFDENDWPDRKDYDIRQFESLVWDLVDTDMHLEELDSEPFNGFSNRMTRRMDLLKTSADKLVEIFISLKRQWLHIVHVLIPESMERINLRVEYNSRIRKEYMKVYVKEFLRFAKAKNRHVIAAYRIGYLKVYPDLSEADLEAYARDSIAALQEELREAEENMLFAAYANSEKMACKIFGSGMEPDLDRLETLQRDRKKVLADLYRMLHPDHLNSRIREAGITDTKRIAAIYKKIKKAWQKVQELRVIETGRSLYDLVAVLIEIKQVLNNEGIRPETRSLDDIPGDTIEHQIEWIEMNIAKFHVWQDIQSAELHSLQNDIEISEFAGHLANRSPEYIERHKQELLDSAQELEESAKKTEAEIAAIFSSREVA